MRRNHESGLFDALIRRAAPLLALVATGCPSAELPSDLGDCPDDSSVTWADTGPVFDANCTSCHASTLVTSEERSNATEGVDFDTPEAAGAQAWLAWSQIYTERMPKDGVIEDGDALILWEWWSCDAPEAR